MQLVGLLEIGGLAPLCCLGVPGGGVSWVTLGFLERAADRGLPLGAWVACVKAKQSLSSDGLRNSRSMFGPRDKRSSMSVTAAASGFVFILLSLPVVQAYDDWRVTYTPSNICAVKGSSVTIRCSYTYPATMNGVTIVVNQKFWFTEQSDDLTTDSLYVGRVSSDSDWTSCSLTITDLRESDSAEYKFRFITNQPDGRWTGSPGVTLSVTALHVVPSGYNQETLSCQSSCELNKNPSYIWYKNGQRQNRQPYIDSHNPNPQDSYSCAVNRLDHSTSPSVCLRGDSCNRVNYSNRSICAFKGSSVDISCTYNSYNNPIQSKLWFNVRQSRYRSIDLSEDSRYAGRVQVLETEGGRSTLRISDLTDADSADYRFKFKTQSFEWGSDLPGTTLTVTALWVQVTRRHVYQSSTKAELKCLSSCSPAGRPSIVWIKNEERTPGKASYEGVFNTGDNISCAFIGHEGYRSPSVYAPRAASAVMSPSGAIMEGSLVNLTCSSDANPAANYTWYKEQTQLSKEPQLVFRSIQSNQSGEYYCTAENELGKKTSENILLQVKCSVKAAAAGSISVIFVIIVFLSLFLFIRRKRSSKQTSESRERSHNIAQQHVGPEEDKPSAAAQKKLAVQQDDLHYASVRFRKDQDDPIYSNVMLPQPNRNNNEVEEEEEDTEYTVVNFTSVTPGLRRQESVEDMSAVQYSTVSKNQSMNTT
ncbi:B-cell receptor CD22-like isoform X4 [Embiotoca jacksoni]|uniref:B-cell receptor CD22-like isoform X4 n=1 Tax=Embiotoca jacksoni TaxID=100190 RepID=UPI003703A9D2